MFKLDFSDWLRGLVAAIVSGGSAAVVSGVTVSTIDPDKFGGGAHMLSLMGILFVTNGAMGMFLYLKQKPLPDLKEVSTKREGLEVAGVPVGPVKVTTTETHAEPLAPNPKPGV